MNDEMTEGWPEPKSPFPVGNDLYMSPDEIKNAETIQYHQSRGTRGRDWNLVEQFKRELRSGAPLIRHYEDQRPALLTAVREIREEKEAEARALMFENPWAKKAEDAEKEPRPGVLAKPGKDGAIEWCWCQKCYAHADVVHDPFGDGEDWSYCRKCGVSFRLKRREEETSK